MLMFLVMIQILALGWMVRGIQVNNLFFVENIMPSQEQFTFLSANTENLKLLLLSKDASKLGRYFTQLFLITLFLGLIIRYAISEATKKQNNATLNEKVWLAINLILFSTQVILLPSNYGSLLMNKSYQEVKVQFNKYEKKNCPKP